MIRGMSECAMRWESVELVYSRARCAACRIDDGGEGEERVHSGGRYQASDVSLDQPESMRQFDEK
jgi:hypothetical protein